MIDALWSHVARRAVLVLWLLAALTAFGRWFLLTVNVSDSLPGTIFIICKGVQPERGDLAAFRYAGGGPYESGVLFLKRVIGVGGSLVKSQETGGGYREFTVDGVPVGRAKPRSKNGFVLEPGPTGFVPPGHFYMAAPNPDSLDSRYALVGWVGEERIVGRAYRLF